MSTHPSKPRRRNSSNGRSPLVFVIPSANEATHDVEKRIMAEVERHNYDERSVYAIRLSLQEALVNAVKHGNKYDIAKKVQIEATVTPRQAEITIEDQGKGFDRSDVPD